MKAGPSKTAGRPTGKTLRRGTTNAPNRRAAQHGVGLDDRDQEQPLDRKRARDEDGSRKQNDTNRRQDLRHSQS